MVREFLGALLINKAKKGIFVSTADHYSKETIKTIDKILNEDIVTKFDLIDFKKFIEILNAVKCTKEEPWIKLID